jgi:hypothetical protein
MKHIEGQDILNFIKELPNNNNNNNNACKAYLAKIK